jgi:ribonucleotide reductase alpha subunit
MGDPCPLISEEIYELMKTKKDEINSIIDMNRDFLLDFFGFKTLEKSYLLRVRCNDNTTKVVESPQYLFLRVALGIHGSDLDRVKETYDLLSTKYFTHATPTLYNSGTRNPQMFSCFL